MAHQAIILLVLFAVYFERSWTFSINCAFATASYDPLGSIYRCQATILVETRADRMTVVYGKHQSGKNNSHVQVLHIENQNLDFFPRNVEEFFPNLKVFYFPNNLISTISNDHLLPFPNLVRLSISTNKLTTLDSNLLSGLSSLKYVHFGSNNLRHVGHDFVLPTSGAVYFSSNPCIDTYTTSASGIVNLKFSLLVKCPPSLSQLETALEGRSNFITNLNVKVQSLTNTTYSLVESHIQAKTDIQNNQNLIESLKNKNLQLETKVAYLEATVENILDIILNKAKDQ